MKRERRLIASARPKQWDSALEKYEYENSAYRRIRSDTITKDLKRMHIKIRFRGFPSGPGVKTSPSNAGGSGLIPHASWPKKKQT